MPAQEEVVMVYIEERRGDVDHYLLRGKRAGACGEIVEHRVHRDDVPRIVSQLASQLAHETLQRG